MSICEKPNQRQNHQIWLQSDFCNWLYGDKVWKIPLYWHYWAVESEFYRKFNADIIYHVKNKLGEGKCG